MMSLQCHWFCLFTEDGEEQQLETAKKTTASSRSDQPALRRRSETDQRRLSPSDRVHHQGSLLAHHQKEYYPVRATQSHPDIANMEDFNDDNELDISTDSGSIIRSAMLENLVRKQMAKSDPVLNENVIKASSVRSEDSFKLLSTRGKEITKVCDGVIQGAD